MPIPSELHQFAHVRGVMFFFLGVLLRGVLDHRIYDLFVGLMPDARWKPL